MPAYIVATVTVSDVSRFAEYGRAIAGLSDRFGGESIVKGAVSEILEGEGTIGERVVVTRFADADAARGYVASAEYQAGRALRDGAAEIVMRLVIL